MSIKVSVKTNQVMAVSTELLRKMPFALNSAIIRTSAEAITAAQDEVRTHITIRQPWVINQIRVLQNSRPTNLVSIMGILNKRGSNNLLLSSLEEGEGGEKLPRRGGALAVPITGGLVRPTFPQSARTSPYAYTKLQIRQGKGRKDTFVIPGIGIFARTGKRTIVRLYSFLKQAPLRPKFAVRRVILDVIHLRFKQIFSEEYIKEIKGVQFK